MWNSKLAWRRFLTLSGSVLAASVVGYVLGQAGFDGEMDYTASKEMLSVGVVLPTTGNQALGGFGTQIIVGSAANNGAIMAAEEILGSVGPAGRQFRALISSAPDAASAVRAAERMVNEEGAYAIIGGFSTEEAQALSELAIKDDFIFLNIGAQSDSLRGKSCNEHTFHLAASTAMYLDAMVAWYTQAGFQRWFFVYNDSLEQKANLASAERLVQAHSTGNSIGSFMVAINESLYAPAFADIAKARPDVVVLLLTPNEQLTFLGQFEAAGLEAELIGYPSATAQTRKFYAAYLQDAPKSSSVQHLALWEATLSTDGAADLNSRYLGRFGLSMDPSAWAAYAGIKIMAEAAVKAGSTESADLIKYMQDAQNQFGIGKGTGTSFRPWDHQMRQPLYLIKTNRDFKDSVTLLDLAELESVLPPSGNFTVSVVQRLDQLGIGEADSECHLATGEQ